MKLLDKILCIIDAVLMAACLVFEFAPVAAVIRTVTVVTAAIYNLCCLIFFEVRKHIKKKD